MRRIYIGILICVLVVSGTIGVFILKRDATTEEPISEETISLPSPSYESDTSVEEALRERRSIRSYSDEPLTLHEMSQLLWAAQGVTDERGFRTAPSAGALYPLEIYVVVGNVTDLSAGIYKYFPETHKLRRIIAGDKRKELAVAALGQAHVERGAIDLVFSAVYERTTRKYGERGIRYVHMEVGHAAQNVYLQAKSLNLGTVVIGAFHDDRMKKLIGMPEEEEPLYIMPIGNI